MPEFIERVPTVLMINKENGGKARVNRTPADIAHWRDHGYEIVEGEGDDTPIHIVEQATGITGAEGEQE